MKTGPLSAVCLMCFFLLFALLLSQSILFYGGNRVNCHSLDTKNDNFTMVLYFDATEDVIFALLKLSFVVAPLCFQFLLKFVRNSTCNCILLIAQLELFAFKFFV